MWATFWVFGILEVTVSRVDQEGGLNPESNPHGGFDLLPTCANSL